jgi:hypothetical protein
VFPHSTGPAQLGLGGAFSFAPLPFRVPTVRFAYGNSIPVVSPLFGTLSPAAQRGFFLGSRARDGSASHVGHATGPVRCPTEARDLLVDGHARLPIQAGGRDAILSFLKNLAPPQRGFSCGRLAPSHSSNSFEYNDYDTFAHQREGKHCAEAQVPCEFAAFGKFVRLSMHVSNMQGPLIENRSARNYPADQRRDST